MLSVNSIHISQLYVSHTVTIAFLSVAKFSKSDHKDRPGVDISGILSTHKISENGYRWLLGTEKILEVGYRWVTGTVEISKDGYRWIPGTSQWKNFWYRWVLGTGRILNDADPCTNISRVGFLSGYPIPRKKIAIPIPGILGFSGFFDLAQNKNWGSWKDPIPKPTLNIRILLQWLPIVSSGRSSVKIILISHCNLQHKLIKPLILWF